ncbi:hypothetical protein GCM10008096_29680 [Zhihengliuella salsuginis]|uniref:Uncharacterized protein n=1 Tax=Zhihengliuella salsuginis TaxID=578222 RepID=A0ABQ3GL12_9MICC|nr:hypothetical protein GCM10008096_29680 [Zhihengliuella salsuginis]
MPFSTAPRITALSPGQSPPLVKIPMRMRFAFFSLLPAGGPDGQVSTTLGLTVDGTNNETATTVETVVAVGPSSGG